MTEDTLTPGRDGVLTRNGATYDIVFERRLKQPIEKVWAAITVPERIAAWFTPMRFEPDLRLGARVIITFSPDDVVEGEVTVLEAPRVFAYRELYTGGASSTLRFQLEPSGAGTRLVFSQVGFHGKSREGMADVAAGWHGMLDTLTRLMAGETASHDEQDELPLSPRYTAMLDRMWEAGDADGDIRPYAIEAIPNGTLRKCDDGYEIVFVRRLRKPIEKVWAALTTPERIADWFTDMRFIPDLRLGARVELRFPDDDPPYEMTTGEVVAFDPPRLFAWSWPETDHPDSIVRCELAPDGEGCVLTFSQSGMGTKHLTGSASGWQVFLDGLEGAADGIRTPGSIERERAIRPAYEVQLAALG